MTHAVLLLSTADTELLAARGSGALYRIGQPGPGRPGRRCPRCWTACRSWWCGCSAAAGPGRRASTRCSASGLPVVLLGGEAAPDAELMAASTVPAGRGRRGAGLPGRGRPGQPARAAPVPVRHGAADRRGVRAAGAPRPTYGVHGGRPHDPDRPTVGDRLLPGARAVRQHRLRRHAVRGASRRAARNALPVYCGSLRGADPELLRPARRGCRRAGRHGAGGRRHQRGGRDARAATRTPGTPGRWPRWTCRCCRGCA